MIDAFPYRQADRWADAIAKRTQECEHVLKSDRPHALTMSCTKCYFTRAMTAEEITERPKP